MDAGFIDRWASQIAFVIVILAPVSLWVLAIIDAAKSKLSREKKLLWLLVVILIPFLGFILYFSFGRQKR